MLVLSLLLITPLAMLMLVVCMALLRLLLLYGVSVSCIRLMVVFIVMTSLLLLSRRMVLFLLLLMSLLPIIDVCGVVVTGVICDVRVCAWLL